MQSYGWRARIGHIYPAVVAENFLTEIFSMLPKGVTLAMNNLVIWTLKPEVLKESWKLIEERAEWLAKRKVDIITIGGSPMWRLMGVGSDRDLIDRLEKKFGIPVTTNQTVAIEAFKKLGVKKIAVASPYFDLENNSTKKFLEGSGFEVVNIKGLSKEPWEIHELPLETTYQHAKKVFYENPKAEAVYIPCAHFACPYLDELERDLRVPVVNSNTAMLWYCFNLLNIRDPIRGHGRLLASLSE